MSASALGWVSKRVRHSDGREGVIASEYLGFCHCALGIAVTGGGSAYVQLNTNGRDTGEMGWQWWCENYADGARFLPLSDAA